MTSINNVLAALVGYMLLLIVYALICAVIAARFVTVALLKLTIWIAGPVLPEEIHERAKKLRLKWAP